MMLALSLALVLQAPLQRPDFTSPPSGDTVGYWQQRVAYRITATLDEQRGVASGRADLTYINQSPDTLRELYVHQHLNAFRPASAWSRADEREGRVRFQRLADPHYGYERFTAAPTVNGVPVTPRYPGAPDSTVVVFTLPRALPPGDSILVHFEWEARPSTLPRRQGRRGRSFDFAQWYPRVAVYDRGGWQANPLVPAGEFYGEFGTYDVTLVLPEDQVIGATGVPVAGDPGWQRALRHGAVHLQADAYASVPSEAEASVPSGFKRVRFVARDVHHFAWSTAPDYRYEGGVYVRPAGGARARFATWDTVAVHVLYQPGDEATWGNGVVVGRTVAALRWLEAVYGPYGYPQMTTLHRIEGGGTEFPMMMMNGSPSQGLIVHEGGHIFTHGILATNEWRSGWLDEGLTSYQTAWATRSTPQDRPLLDSIPALPHTPGYRGRAVRPDPMQAARMDQQRQVFIGRAEPLGTRADEFNEFAVYNAAVYTRAEIMYGALREVLGDSLFAAFLRNYYARWAFKHVDELAMRAAAERVSGMNLGWFFRQWVHDVGNVDYALADVDSEREAGGVWATTVRIQRRGSYAHPMPIGVRTVQGWTVQRADTGASPSVVIRTGGEPLDVRLDPWQTTYDWDRRNDGVTGSFGTAGRRQLVFDWPFLEQASSDRQLVAWRPWVMYGSAGGYAVGARVRSNYQGWIDRSEVGFATSVGALANGGSRDAPGAWRNLWFSLENPTLRRNAPTAGLRAAAWYVDEAVRIDLSRSWDVSRFLVGPRRTWTLGFTALATSGLDYLPRAQWDDATVHELSFSEVRRAMRPDSLTVRLTASGGVVTPPGFGFSGARGYGRFEGEARLRRPFAEGRMALSARAYRAHATSAAPLQRQFRLAAQDPFAAFGNHFLRPAGAPLEDADVRYVQLGGGGLRAFGPAISARDIGGGNLEVGRVLFARDSTPRALRLWLNAFADVASVDTEGSRPRLLADAGLGLAIRGMLYDQPVRIRVDLPLLLSRREIVFAGDRRWVAENGIRWTFSLNDFW